MQYLIIVGAYLITFHLATSFIFWDSEWYNHISHLDNDERAALTIFFSVGMLAWVSLINDYIAKSIRAEKWREFWKMWERL